jgi:hypothetical protein
LHKEEILLALRRQIIFWLAIQVQQFLRLRVCPARYRAFNVGLFGTQRDGYLVQYRLKERIMKCPD